MALSNQPRRAPTRRRPQDAPRLSVVPRTAEPDPSTGRLDLPEALAGAVLDQATPPKTANTAQAPTEKPKPQETAPAGQETEESTEVAVVEGRSAADAERAIRWLGVTYRPPDVWRERQPSLKEEWDFVMDGSHLPEQGPWRAAARGYAAPTIALIGALHLAVWILRSPARHATAWLVLALPVVTAVFML